MYAWQMRFKGLKRRMKQVNGKVGSALKTLGRWLWPQPRGTHRHIMFYL